MDVNSIARSMRPAWTIGLILLISRLKTEYDAILICRRSEKQATENLFP